MQVRVVGVLVPVYQERLVAKANPLHIVVSDGLHPFCGQPVIRGKIKGKVQRIGGYILVVSDESLKSGQFLRKSHFVQFCPKPGGKDKLCLSFLYLFFVVGKGSLDPFAGFDSDNHFAHNSLIIPVKPSTFSCI